MAPRALERGLQRSGRQRAGVRRPLVGTSLLLLLGELLRLLDRLLVAVVHEQERELAAGRPERSGSGRLELLGLATGRQRTAGDGERGRNHLRAPVLFRQEAPDEGGSRGAERGVHEALGVDLRRRRARRARAGRRRRPGRRPTVVAIPRSRFLLLLRHGISLQAARRI